MDKYRIQILKVEEDKEGKSFKDYPYFGLDSRETVIFNALMSSDNTIEILQHLHDLREKQEKAKKSSE